MTNHDDNPRLEPPLDPEQTEAIRALYAPPGGDGYWAVLESRIRDRIAAVSVTGDWWQVVGRWGRGGIIAAAAAIAAAVAGALLLHAHAAELRTAYESIAHPAPAESVAVPAGALSERDGPDRRGATFRDVISH